MFRSRSREKKTSLVGNADSRLKVRVAPPASANKQVAQRPMWEGGGGNRNVENGATWCCARLNFSNVKPASKSPKHMTAAGNKIPGAIRKLPSDSGIRRKIQTQESSRPRRWWSDSGMMPVIQTQESMFLVRFWNNRQETRSRFLKFS
jgi:hypothetical protein